MAEEEEDKNKKDGEDNEDNKNPSNSGGGAVGGSGSSDDNPSGGTITTQAPPATGIHFESMTDFVNAVKELWATFGAKPAPDDNLTITENEAESRGEYI